RQDHHAFLGLERIQAAFDREFAAIRPTAEQVSPGTHRARLRDVEKAPAKVFVLAAQTFRHQYLDRLAYQGAALVLKKLFGLGIDQDDPPATIDHDHRARRIFDDALKAFLQAFAFGNVDNRRQHHESLPGIDRRQAELYGELTAVAAPGIKIAPTPHR